MYRILLLVVTLLFMCNCTRFKNMDTLAKCEAAYENYYAVGCTLYSKNNSIRSVDSCVAQCQFVGVLLTKDVSEPCLKVYDRLLECLYTIKEGEPCTKCHSIVTELYEC